MNELNLKESSVLTIYNCESRKLTKYRFTNLCNYIGYDSSYLYFTKKSTIENRIIPEIFSVDFSGEINLTNKVYHRYNDYNFNDSTDFLYFDSDFFILQKEIKFPKYKIFIKVREKEFNNFDDVMYLYSNLFFKYNNKLIMMGFNLKKQNLPELTSEIINRPYNKIIQLNSNGDIETIFDSFEYFSKKDPYSLGYLLNSFKIIGDYLLIEIIGMKSEINNEEYNNGLLIYDLKKKNLITKPIKYIEISNENK